MNRSHVLLVVLGLTSAASVARADVRHDGAWPVELKHVSIDASHITRTEGIEKVAKAAGWSVVTRIDDEGKPFDMHVDDQPADKVLDMVLGEGDFVVHRDGTMFTISSAPVAVKAAPPPIIATPVATTRGEDRMVRGGDLVVGANETVHDVIVYGGSVTVEGTATGNVTVLGGSAHVRKNAHIVGSATAVGGSIDIDDGAQVDGDVGVVGGVLDRHKGAKIGGAIHKNDDVNVGGSSGKDHGILREVTDATTRAAMLFIFGAVLFALASGRMNALRIEAASRPMRSFALGIVGGLLGLLAIAIIGITIIGLPVAAVLLIGAIFGAYAGICAVLATVGKALVGHKSDNPHVHLLVGCALFLVSGAIPFVNGLITLAVVLTGIGVVVATRGAGTFASKRDGGTNVGGYAPYRTDSVY